MTAPAPVLSRVFAEARLHIVTGKGGTGKTTVARLLADATELHFEQISAVFSGVADLKKAIFGSDLTFGQGVTDIVWKGREIEPRDEGSTLVAGRIRFALSYVENLAAP